MNEELKKTLKDNSLEYYNNGLEAENKGDYNTSVTLFFKAIGSLTDFYMSKTLGINSGACSGFLSTQDLRLLSHELKQGVYANSKS